jgi:hypothetical protein
LVPIEGTQNAFLQNEPVDSRRELAGIYKTPLNGGSQRPDLRSTAAPDACSVIAIRCFSARGNVFNGSQNPEMPTCAAARSAGVDGQRPRSARGGKESVRPTGGAGTPAESEGVDASCEDPGRRAASYGF